MHVGTWAQATRRARLEALRRALFKLSSDGQAVRLTVLSDHTGEDADFIMEEYREGNLPGYKHSFGANGGFRRLLSAVR